MNRVEEFIQQPGAPNLYWSLTDLPRPLIDLHRPLQGERVFIDTLYPEILHALKDAKAPPIPAETLRANLDKLAALGVRSEPVASAVSAATIYPRARKFLLAQGRSPEDVAALPIAQVALMYGVAQHVLWSDELYKLNNLPYWEARPRLKEIDDRFRANGKGHTRAADPFGWQPFFPGYIYQAQARLQRQIDLLRCVEAVRLYAAAHDGTLPAALEDIREAPIPIDPMTGKAFGYTKDGNRAVLEATAPPGAEASEQNAVRIEITLAPKN
jgi:hypothetical protein